MKRKDLIDAPERRGVPADGFEIRKDSDTFTLSGYASVFDSPYDVYGGPPMGWAETIDVRAFDKTLDEKPDLHLLINHEGMPLARTKSGTLRLSVDKVGLKVSADLDPNDPDAQRLAAKMGRGDMDEMSFAFRVKRQEWNEEETERRITEVSLHKGDVSVVNFGANPATSAQMRSFVEQIADADSDLAELRLLSDERVLEASRRLAEIARSRQPVVSRGALAKAHAVLAARELNGTE